MKSNITRFLALVVGMALASMVQFCAGGDIPFGGEIEKKDLPLEAMFDPGMVEQVGEETTEIILKPKFPEVVLQPPSLNPNANEFFIKYCSSMTPNRVFFGNLKSALFKDHQDMIKKFVDRIEEIIGLKFSKTPGGILFIFKLDESSNVATNWLIVVGADSIDIDQISPNFERLEIDQFDVYKIKENVYLAKQNGLIVAGHLGSVKDMLDPNVITMVSAYFKESGKSILRFVMNSADVFKDVREYIDFGDNKPVNYIAGVDMNLVTDNMIEAIISAYADEHAVMTSVVKIDSNRLNKERFMKAIWDKIAKYFGIDQEGVDQIEQDKYEEMKDSATNIQSLDQMEKPEVGVDQDNMNLNQ